MKINNIQEEKKPKRFPSCSILLMILPIFLVSLASCGGATYRIYAGNPLPRERIAVLKIPGDGSSPPAMIRIRAVDGVRKRSYYGGSWDGSGEIEFLPGKHTVSVWMKHPDFSAIERNVSFRAEAGKTYVFRYELVKDDMGLFYIEMRVEDESTVQREKYKIDW